VLGRMSEKVCVITGTGGSIGRATALTFSREGALVVGCGQLVAPAEATVDMVHAAGGERVSMQPCDLTEPAECKGLVDLALRTYGRIDVLFNLAAASYFNWFEDITNEEWDRARRGEVDLVFYLTRAAWPHLKARGGVIVNMASLNATLSFKILPSLAHTTNKAGVIGMTRQLALESAMGVVECFADDGDAFAVPCPAAIQLHRVGMPWTAKRAETPGAWSTLTLTTLSRPARSSAACSTPGATVRHGPHPGAHRSTSTGRRVRIASAKSASPASTTHGRSR
jgi:NADP-dependent 3-hydroxy acid dehydrogenase YdfG